MKNRWIARVTLLACVALTTSARAADPTTWRLPAKQDIFFIEHDFAYSRLLQLARDGTYRQINRERTAAAEVDRGTWEQTADGTVLLRFTRGALRFHALLSGPLSLTLDTPGKLAALPAAADAIRRWLARGQDLAFAPASAAEIPLAPLVLTIDPAAESLRRDDLVSLARQIDEFVWTEQHRTLRCTPLQPSGGPRLLVLQGAVFQPTDLARVRQEYRLPPGRPPPFYFAQVDAGTFAREAGSWQELH